MRKIISLCLCLSLLGGCSWFSSKGTAVKDAFISCEKGKIPADVLSILAQVTTVILAGGTGYQAKLEDIGKNVGEEALACAVKSLAGVFAAAAPVGSGSGAATAESPFAAAQGRAQSFLSTKGYRFE